MDYNYQEIEKKWQRIWEEKKMFEMDPQSDKPKYYVLDMYPYPSGKGLHVGHPKGYLGTEVFARYLWMKRYEVLHPMGWDAFGLPAENYAIKTNVHPEKSTLDGIKTMKRQLSEIGMSYDWSREIASCLPDYYKWTQWFFAFLYRKGLAYRKKAPVNWCDDCNTVLANEQVVNEKCDRCGNDVEQKSLVQWFFKITDFIEDTEHDGRVTQGLLSGLEKIDWPNSTKVAQTNWIGQQDGIDIYYDVEGCDEQVSVFTKYPETNFGATFVVIAPEHPIVDKLTKPEFKDQVDAYRDKTSKMTPLERKENKEKSGVFTGAYAYNLLNKKQMPIYLADFVLADYGTGMVVAVPGHDERDFEFAQLFDLDIVRVIKTPDGDDSPITSLEQVDHNGTMVNSDFLDGMDAQTEAKEKIMDYMEEKGYGKRVTFYNLRDWLISRQRFWGAPIPIVYDDEGNEYLVPEEEYPITLPGDCDFKPTGESPLTQSDVFHSPKDLKRIEGLLKKSGDMPKERKLVRRESDTMDTFVCSSWYFWRFMDPHNDKEFADRELMNELGPVDLYVGGAEHTVLHLLYARFFCKVLHRYGFVNYDEPFSKLRHQGMILGENGEKMSKSRGNIITPDAIYREYGTDTLRVYEMFMGPFDQMIPWSTAGVKGAYRFLQKAWKVVTESELFDEDPKGDTLALMHKTLKKVTNDIEDFKFNTAISAMMIFVNHLSQLTDLKGNDDSNSRMHPNDPNKKEGVPRKALEALIICLYPFAPHICEELWEIHIKKMHEKGWHHDDDKLMVSELPWPEWDEELVRDDEVELAVQVNGKLRATIKVPAGIERDDALARAKEIENVKKFTMGKELVKEIFVPGKIVNLVVKG